MRKKTFIALLCISIVLTSLIHISPAQSFWETPEFIRDLDPTDRDSKLREAGRQFDPTKPGGKLEDLKKAAFEIRYCLVQGGCDITRPEIRELVKQEVDNCFLKGGCDPSIPEVRQKGLEYVKKAREVYNNYLSFATDLGKFAIKMADKTFLNGFISRNFGHVTNKEQLRRELESRGIVIYGHEINHDDYMSATTAGIASVTTANPAPLIENLRDLAIISYETILSNTVNAVDKAPTTLKQKYGNQLTTIKSSLTQSINPMFIAESLAEYIMKGKTLNVPKLKGNLSNLSIKFGVLSYNRGEKFFDDRIPLPNTHQPYILIALPELTVEVDNIINQETKQYDEVLNGEDLERILADAAYDELGYNREYLDEEETYFNTFQEAYEEKQGERTSSWKYSVLTYEDTRFGEQGKFVVVKTEGIPTKVNLTTGNGRSSDFKVIEVTSNYLVIHTSISPGSEYYIRLYTSGYVDYTIGKNMSENDWSKWTEGKWDASPTPPACLAKYDPSEYRPGTSWWTGKTAKIAFNNGGANSVQVKLYHPDAPDRIFKEWTAQPGQNIFLDENNYGMDWGIQVDSSPVCIVGRVSAWNEFNGESIFQSGFPFKIHN